MIPNKLKTLFATLGQTWEFQLCLKSCNLASWTKEWHYYVGVSHPPTNPPTHWMKIDSYVC